MKHSEFDEKLIKIDRLLMEKKAPIPERLILAWFYATGKKRLEIMAQDPSLSPYEGSNLYHSIVKWYVDHYPAQATMGRDWGYRLIVIRDQIFRVGIPVHFNPSMPLDAFANIESFTESLRRLLDEDETIAIQTTFNRYFWQASNLALVWTNWCVPPQFDLVSDMIHRGWQDLKDACQAFNPRDPFGVLFTIQQGPEKFLKALILTQDPTMTEKKLQNQFGHSIPKLLEACKQIDADFSRFSTSVRLFDYGPNVRYRNEKISQTKVVDLIDVAYSICDTACKHLPSPPARLRPAH